MVISVPDVAAPNVRVLLKSLAIAPPSPAVPSCECPLVPNAAKIASNSSFESSALIVSPCV